jgi:hypothetical protein
MTGSKLIEKICSSTDLPAKTLEHEMRSLLAAHSLSENELTLEQLREVLAEYLQDTLVDLKKELDAFESC